MYKLKSIRKNPNSTAYSSLSPARTLFALTTVYVLAILFFHSMPSLFILPLLDTLFCPNCLFPTAPAWKDRRLKNVAFFYCATLTGNAALLWSIAPRPPVAFKLNRNLIYSVMTNYFIPDQLCCSQRQIPKLLQPTTSRVGVASYFQTSGTWPVCIKGPGGFGPATTPASRPY